MGVGEKGSFPCLAGEQNGTLIIRKARDLKISTPLAGKSHVISPASTSFCSCYPFLYSSTIKMCIFSENKYPSSLAKNEGICKRTLMQIKTDFFPVSGSIFSFSK